MIKNFNIMPVTVDGGKVAVTYEFYEIIFFLELFDDGLRP